MAAVEVKRAAKADPRCKGFIHHCAAYKHDLFGWRRDTETALACQVCRAIVGRLLPGTSAILLYIAAISR